MCSPRKITLIIAQHLRLHHDVIAYRLRCKLEATAIERLMMKIRIRTRTEYVTSFRKDFKGSWPATITDPKDV